MSCGNLDIEQSFPNPLPGQCSISVMITTHAVVVDLSISALLRFIVFNHISILQHAFTKTKQAKDKQLVCTNRLQLAEPITGLWI